MSKEERPWGHFEVLLDEYTYKVKRLVVHPGKRFSLQLHRHRSEHWHVVAGQGIVTVGVNKLAVQEGSSIDVPKEAEHRAENTGQIPLVLIEVQRGDELNENDIVRLQDDYGRTLS